MGILIDIPDHIKTLGHSTRTRQETPANKTENKVRDKIKKVSYSHLGNFITYKNENAPRITRDKLEHLSRYLYAHMIEGFNLDYSKIADKTFIHKSERLEDTLLCVLNKRTLYVLAIEYQILFSINLDNYYLHLETYDFKEKIERFLHSNYINRERYLYSTLEYIINKMRSAYGLSTNIGFSQNKCELEFVSSDFLNNKDKFSTPVPTFFDINLSKNRKLDTNFNNELLYLRRYEDFIRTLPNKNKDKILDNYYNTQKRFVDKIAPLKNNTYIDNGEIKEYFGYILSSTDTENTFVFRDFNSTLTMSLFYCSKQEAKDLIENAISKDMAKFRDDSEEVINSYREFIKTSGLINVELLKDLYLDKLDLLQSNLAKELAAFDNQQSLTVV